MSQLSSAFRMLNLLSKYSTATIKHSNPHFFVLYLLSASHWIFGVFYMIRKFLYAVSDNLTLGFLVCSLL